MDTAAVKQSSHIQGQEGTIHLDDGGSDGLPVVFTHSFAGDVLHWQNQLDFVRSQQRAIAFDFRGHGKSTSSDKTQYTAEALAGDIAAVVDGLDLEKFVLVGHSMGGSAAIAYSDTHPSRVAGLVLVGTPGKTPSEISEPVIASLRSDAYQKVMDDYMNRLVMNTTQEVKTKLLDGARKIHREESIKIIQSMFEFDPIDMVQRFKGPLLIIATTNDQKQPNALVNQVQGVQTRMIEGTSHWPQLDKPEEFNRILADFLKRIKQ